MKFLIMQKYTSYGYVVIEAECKEAAMKHIPTNGDAIITNSNYYENLCAVECAEDEYLYSGNSGRFVKVSEKNLAYSKRKLERKVGYKPYFSKIDFSKMKKVHLPNGINAQGRWIK